MTDDADNKTQEKITALEQFSKLIQSDIDLALIILKKWLHNIGDKEKCSLFLVAKNLTDAELEELFKNLNYLERNAWKSLSNLNLKSAQIIETEQFIKAEIIKALFDKTENSDSELFDMIINLSSRDIEVFLKSHSDLSSAMLNLLPPNKLSEFFATVDQTEVLNYIQAAYNEKIEPGSKLLNKLKLRLREYHLKKGNKTFTSKLDDMIHTLPPHKEHLVYSPLFNNKDRETISRIANKHFPSQLIERLPKNTLQALLKEYPDEKRATFFASLNDDKRQFYLDCLAPVNTPLREVTEMSIDEIITDKAKFQTISYQQKQLNSEFIAFIRQTMDQSPLFQQVKKDLIESWISEHLDR